MFSAICDAKRKKSEFLARNIMDAGMDTQKVPCEAADVKEWDMGSFAPPELSLHKCPGARAWLFRSPPDSPMISRLFSFRQALGETRSADCDPKWFVTNIYGARFGGGSKELLNGVAVDPKMNPVHRYAIQYLSDIGLLKQLASMPAGPIRDGHSLLVTAVSILDESQPVVNKSIFAHSRSHRLALIAVDDCTIVTSNGVDYPNLRAGEVLVIPTESRHIIASLRVRRGFTIAVVLGYPEAISAKKGKAPTGTNACGFSTTNAKITMDSINFEGSTTVNRRAKTAGMFLPKVSCPDCRRPLEIMRREMEAEGGTASVPDVLVTVVCDVKEAKAAVATGTRLDNQYPSRVIFLTDPMLADDDLKSSWPVQLTVSVLRKHAQPRGLQDYEVPPGFVSPVLFPRLMNPPVKDTAYTIIQALGCDELWGKCIRLVDPNGRMGVSVVPNSTMYSRMMTELRDWNHPCHHGRYSGISLIQEWLDAYN